ncbi:SDR family NAD(P)-dependent oxidoreductase, partial [Streptomyces pseudogriseolus]
VTRFVELGPDATLTPLTRATLDDTTDPVCVAVQRKDRSETDTLVAALAVLHTTGAPVDWAAMSGAVGTVPLPTYAFQRRRYWPEPRRVEAGASGGAVAPAEDAFWKAVERGDTRELADALHLDDATLGTVLPALSAWRRLQTEQLVADSWRYRVHWRRLDSTGVPAGADTGRWLLLQPVNADASDDTAPGDPASGDTPLPGIEEFLPGIERLTCPADADRATLAALLTDAATAGGGAPLAGVLSCLPGVATALAVVQAHADARLTAPLWLLTSGAVTVGTGTEAVVEPSAAAVWGLGRVAALEHPDRWGGLLDLPARPDRRALARAAAVLTSGAEDQVAVRGGTAHARRLVPAPAPVSATTGEWTAPERVLVTGGTGALGSRVARWAVARGARELVLTSRRGPDAPGADVLRADLERLGAKVTVVACDTGDRDAVARLLAAHPVDAVMHAAGILDDEIITGCTPERLAAVLRAKADAADHLDALTRDSDLTAFVVFSSVAGVWGSGGQAAYAAANAHLDALVERRRARGLAGTAVAWGPWDGTGMAADPAAQETLRRRGLRPLDPDAALTALGRALVARD